MLNEIDSYARIASELRTLAPRLAKNGIVTNENVVLQLCENIDAKLADFKPNLMVYGCYNAGKSTLLNAIFGEVKAKMGDTPETYKVDEYDFKGYRIYDTPGLHAPIEHEEVTQAHYKKCEAVMFVMSNDSGFEESYIYDKIRQIVLDKKPLIVVLNDKRGFGADSAEVARQKARIMENLAKLNLSVEEVSKIRLIAVNATSALKGKLENKRLLVESSNIAQLEDFLFKCLENSGRVDIIRTLNSHIKGVVEGWLGVVNSKEQDEEIRRVKELIAKLDEQSSETRRRVAQVVRLEISPLEVELTQAFLNKSGSTESIVKRRVDQAVKSIESEFDVMKGQLKNACEEFSMMPVEFKPSVESESVLASVGSLLTTLLASFPHIFAKIAAFVVPLLQGLTSFLSAREQEKANVLAAQNAAQEICYKVSEGLTSQAVNLVKENFDNSKAKLERELSERVSDKNELEILRAGLSGALAKLPVA